jgi:transcriptional regulator GlxA family with amidase domain
MKTTIVVTSLLLVASAAFAGGPGHCYDPSSRAGYVCAADACAGNDEIAKKDGACKACGQKLAAVKGLTHVAVVLYDGVDLFDLAGPSEAFANAGGFYVYTVTEDGRAVRSGGLDVEPDYSIESCPWPDVLVVAGRVSKNDHVLLANWTELVGKDADFVLKTGGVSSGIDGALNIVAKMKGDESARRAARAMEYDGWLAHAGGQR